MPQPGHPVGERIDAHDPAQPAAHVHGKKRAGEQPHRQQKNAHHGVETLRRIHPPGDHEAQRRERDRDHEHQHDATPRAERRRR